MVNSRFLQKWKRPKIKKWSPLLPAFRSNLQTKCSFWYQIHLKVTKFWRKKPGLYKMKYFVILVLEIFYNTNFKSIFWTLTITNYYHMSVLNMKWLLAKINNSEGHLMYYVRLFLKKVSHNDFRNYQIMVISYW